MPRNKAIIKRPTLNDKGGDLSKKWYVEWYYYVPGEVKPRKRRCSEGMCIGSAEERYKAAEEAIRKINAILDSPTLLRSHPDELPKIMADELNEPVVQRYNDFAASINIRRSTADFVAYMQGAVAQKTYETYKSKLKIFAQWITQSGVSYTRATQQEIVPFFQYLSNERHLTKRTIFKYKQILRAFYDWLVKQSYCFENPVFDIPNYGCIVDCAPRPICASDRQRLREAIERADPYLWLACEIQYYCAIRPGTELRLLRVGDIDLPHQQITIRAANAKNRRKDVVPITPQIAELIRRMGIAAYSPDLYVFGTYNMPAIKPVGKNTLRNRFNRFRDDLNINKDIKFYSWKHSGAISMVENGATVWQVQHHMRHNSITTTEEYIRQRASQSRTAQNFIDEI